MALHDPVSYLVNEQWPTCGLSVSTVQFCIFKVKYIGGVNTFELLLARALAFRDLEQVAIILIIHLSSSSSSFFSPAFYFSTRRVGARALKFSM